METLFTRVQTLTILQRHQEIGELQDAFAEHEARVRSRFQTSHDQGNVLHLSIEIVTRNDTTGP